MSAETARQRLEHALADHGCSVRGSAAQCPAHEDRSASLSIGSRRDGTGAVVKCHAGCETDAVLEALGMSAADLFDEPRERRDQSGTWTPYGEAVAVYRYTDEHGKLLFEVCRTARKDFPQRRPDPTAKHGWRWTTASVRQVPYRLPAVIEAAKNGAGVWIAEGEKDVHALEAAGVTATCNPGGAERWKAEYAQYLAGARVTVVADRDSAGRKWAAAVRASLAGVAASVRTVEAAKGKDAHDHLSAGRGLDEFADLADLGDLPGEVDGEVDGEVTQPDLTMEIERRKLSLRIEAAARDSLAAEAAPPIPPSYSGNVFLSQPDSGPNYRIADLWPAGGNIVLAAQFKAGKTTMRDNLIRSLSDASPFLRRYAVTAPAGRVYVMDCEMPDRAARRWLNNQMITRQDRFEYMNLRGAVAAFNILVPHVRKSWAHRMRDAGAAVVILDCIGPVLAALGLDENKAIDVGRFLACLEELLADADVPESFVIHHMGHDGERARGASRLRDWPDAEWRLVRRDDNPASPRYMSAFGRDVDVKESRLDFDDETRHLEIGHGSRRSDGEDAARADLVRLLRAEPGLSASAIEKKLEGDHSREAIRDAVRKAVADGQVVISEGPRNAKIHRLNPEFADLAAPRRDESGEVGLTSPDAVGDGEVKPALFGDPTSPKNPARSWPEGSIGEGAA